MKKEPIELSGTFVGKKGEVYETAKIKQELDVIEKKLGAEEEFIEDKEQMFIGGFMDEYASKEYGGSEGLNEQIEELKVARTGMEELEEELIDKKSILQKNEDDSITKGYAKETDEKLKRTASLLRRIDEAIQAFEKEQTKRA